MEKIKGRWKVSYNPMGGDKPYIVFRLKDTNKIQCSGNMEYGSDYMASKSEAQAIADRLNEEENEE